jgi:ribonuclease HI
MICNVTMVNGLNTYLSNRVLVNMYSLYFDGASRGNPGLAGYGAVLYDADGKIIDECYSRLSGICTNNQAEYAGLLNGLKMVRRNNVNKLEVYGDSNLIIQQLNRKWKVKSEGLLLYYDACKDISDDFDYITFHHVKRNLNKHADMLANRALDNIV